MMMKFPVDLRKMSFPEARRHLKVGQTVENEAYGVGIVVHLDRDGDVFVEYPSKTIKTPSHIAETSFINDFVILRQSIEYKSPLVGQVRVIERSENQ